jgi:hypothetical protein
MDVMTAATSTTPTLNWASREAMDARYAELQASPDGNVVLNVMWWVDQHIADETKAIEKLLTHKANGYRTDYGQLEDLAKGSVHAHVAKKIDLVMASLHSHGEFVPADTEVEHMIQFFTREVVIHSGRPTSAMANEMSRLELEAWQDLLSMVTGY